MPLFLIVSGALFAPEKFSGPRSLLGKLSVLIVWPYLLWSIVQGAVLVVMARFGAVNSVNADWSWLLEIGWSPLGQFWFLYALFIAQVLAFFAYRRVPVWGMAAISLAAFAWFMVTRGPEVTILVSYGCFYFALGMMARKVDLFGRLPSRWPGALALLAAGAAIAVICLLTEVVPYWPIPAAIVMSLATISVCKAMTPALAGRSVGRWFAIIGQCSMGIYVLHILAIGAIRLGMTRFMGITDPALLLVGITLVATLVPVAVQLVALRLGIEKWCGMPSSAKPFTATGLRAGTAAPAS